VDADVFARSLQRWIPDPFAIALALTLLAFGLAWTVGDATAPELIDGWISGPRGMWSLLSFAMQMCLILVTGFAVANTGPVQSLLAWVATQAKTPGQAAALVSVVSMVLALFNWGLGLIAGALLAREVGRAMHAQGKPVHYPLLAAAGYTGMCVWHCGLSGSAPLKVSQMGNLQEVLGPALAQSVGALELSRTVFSVPNIAVTLTLLVVVPTALWAMAPSSPDRCVPPPREAPAPHPAPARQGLAGALESGPWLIIPIVVGMGGWTARWLASDGLATLDPNSMNLVFLMIGLMFAGSPAAYMAHAHRAASATAGIIVQFPFYAGILGILAAGGLVPRLAHLLPTGEALPMATFISAGALNLFVPSGGGQWSLQGPVVMSAAIEGGTDPGRVVMALAWGDQWTNLVQPFWALPLLGITGTRASDILGYTSLLAVLVGIVGAIGCLIPTL